MEQDRILDKEAVFSCLYPDARSLSQCEENRHAWRVRDYQSYEKPLLRIWDQYSGSEPIDGHGMESRAPDMRLDTFEKRRSTLADHLDHRQCIPGPYISFTTSPTAIEDLVRMRVNNRGRQTLTVIDPNTRIRNGLPVLDVPTEMESYDILDPYGRGNQYYENHHVCLWEVTEAEIVGHWEWNTLEQDKNWYENIIMPEFRSFTGTASRPRSAESDFNNATSGAMDDLLSNLNDLSSRLSMLTWTLPKLIFKVDHDDQDCSDPDFSDQDCSDPDCSHSDWEDEFENSYPDKDHYWDTDDGREKVHIADDALEFIEPNW